MPQQAQRRLVGVPLPDAVEAGRGDADGFSLQDVVGHIVQHAVPQVHRVVQTVHRHPRAVGLCRVLEHPLAPLAGHAVLAHRLRPRLLRGTPAVHTHFRVQVPAGEHDDAAALVPLGHPAGQPGVHRPGGVFIAVRAELFARHVDDVLRVRQAVQRAGRQQVRADHLHPVLPQQLHHQRVAEARHRDDSLFHSRRPQRVLCQNAQRRPHFSARAQHQDVSLQPSQLPAQRLARRRQHFVQSFFRPHFRRSPLSIQQTVRVP